MRERKPSTFFKNNQITLWKKILVVLAVLFLSIPNIISSLASPTLDSLRAILLLLIVWWIFFSSRSLSFYPLTLTAILCGAVLSIPAGTILIYGWFGSDQLRDMAYTQYDWFLIIAYPICLALLIRYLMRS